MTTLAGESIANAGDDAAHTDQLSNALYASCVSYDTEKLYFQEDLLDLNVIPGRDANQLLKCLTSLSRDMLFKLHSKDGRSCWRVVKREDAAKYKTLSTDEAVVYSYIESAGREGIWTRTIRTRSNLHQTVLNKAIKVLEGKSLIKSIQSARFTKRKIYILSHLQPSEDVTGGPFFTEGSLDEEFVRIMGLQIEGIVFRKSWYASHARSPSKNKGKSHVPGSEAKASREQELDKPAKFKLKIDERAVLPMPPGFIGYPTIPEITKAVNELRVSAVVMKEVEVEQLVDILCWDGRLMKVMEGRAYKYVRRQSEANAGAAKENGLTEAPCGRCPVFDLCDESGPVNARTCVYFQDWLGS